MSIWVSFRARHYGVFVYYLVHLGQAYAPLCRYLFCTHSAQYVFRDLPFLLVVELVACFSSFCSPPQRHFRIPLTAMPSFLRPQRPSALQNQRHMEQIGK
jgi:hypothetical protein